MLSSGLQVVKSSGNKVVLGFLLATCWCTYEGCTTYILGEELRTHTTGYTGKLYSAGLIEVVSKKVLQPSILE